MTDQLIETQRALEASSLKVGAEAYKASQNFKAAQEGVDKRNDSQTAIRGALPLVSREIALWLEVEGGKEGRGRRHAALQYLRECDADHMAYAGLSRTFQGIIAGKSLPSIAIAIGSVVETELEALAIKATDKKVAAKFAKMVKQRDEEANQMAHDRLADRLEVRMNWDDPLKALIGGVVLSAVLKGGQDLFKRGVVGSSASSRQSVIEFTSEATEMMDKMTEDAAWMHPKYVPMVCPPNPWTGYGTGAYLTRELAKTVPLVRTRSSEQKRMLKEAIAGGTMDDCMAAASALGATRWAIDVRVAEQVAWCSDMGHKPSKSFPLSKGAAPKLPKKLKKEEWDALDPDVRTAMSRSRKTLRDIRKAGAIDRTVLDGDLGMAGFLSEHEAFYLPHNYDFRQRIYPVPFFNHQRPDHLKGMMHFADAVPLGEHGGKWLMIHLANCGDFGKVSKKPFEARLQWVRDNEGMILSCARYPEESYEFWSEADSPFLFLQACFDYAEWMDSGFSPDHCSRGIAAIDGSCSGLQHYSAMMRAEQEAYHVNLVPRDTVGDIYQVVADKARPTMTFMASPEWLAHNLSLAASGVVTSKSKTPEELVAGIRLDNRAAQVILEQGFGRSEAKRPTMTYFYGSAKFGMRDQYMDDIMRPLTDKVALAQVDEKTGRPYEHGYALLSPKTGQLDGGFACAQVMAMVVHEAIETVAPKAAEAAEWYQLVAGILAHEGKSVVWTTPVGFPVVHRYSEYESKVVNMWLYDRTIAVLDADKASGMPQVDAQGRVSTRVQMVLRGAPTKRIDKHKARSAVAPNLVHSMDGAHMTRVIVMAVAAGIRDMAMIHDSFGCHYGHMERFAQIVREAFIRTYRDYCPFEAVLEKARVSLDEAGQAKLPSVPEKGALDLECVSRALYAFA